MIIKDSNKRKIILNITYVLICICISIIYLFEFYDSKINVIKYIKYPTLAYVSYFAFCAVISVIIYFAIKLIKNRNVKIHKKFAIIAGIFGIIYIFGTPMFRGSDELPHFCRAYEISTGDLITPVNEQKNAVNDLPTSIDEFAKLGGEKGFEYTNLFKHIFHHLNDDVRRDYKNYYISISLYSPIQYIPQAIGMFIARHLNFSIYFVGIFGRITGFLFWLFICTYALKKLPSKKIAFMILMLSPIFIGYATTLSGDMMLNAMAMLLISHVYYYRFNRCKIKRKDLAIIILSCLVISLCKVVYVPIVFSVFLIPKECFNNKKDYFRIFICTVFVSGILAVSWFLYSNSAYLNNFYDNSQAQKHFILNNPITYMIIMLRTLFYYSLTYLSYSSQMNVSPIICVIIWIIFLLSLLNNENKNEKKALKIEKIILTIITTLVIILVQTAIYIQFTAMTVSVGNHLVEGVQARYFLPVIILLSIFVNKKKVMFDENNLLSTFIIMYLPVFITMFIVYF